MPAAIGQRELRFPHPRVERKRVQKKEDAARANVRAGRGLQIAESSYRWHEPIVNVPPPRVESEKPTATVHAGVPPRQAFRRAGTVQGWKVQRRSDLTSAANTRF